MIKKLNVLDSSQYFSLFFHIGATILDPPLVATKYDFYVSVIQSSKSYKDTSSITTIKAIIDNTFRSEITFSD